MKEQPHNWEADIRKRTLEHEFDYDPQAWNDLSQLLDEVVIPAPTTKGNAVSDFSRGGFGKIILSVLFMIGIVALWYFYQPNPSIDQLSDQTTTTEIKTLPSIGKETKIQVNTPTNTDEASVQTISKKSTPYQSSVQNRQSKITEPLDNNIPEPTVPEVLTDLEKATMLIAEELLERQNFTVVDILPKKQEIPLLKIPVKPIKLEPNILTPKRKRDKTKLYPDVIENY